MLQVPTLCPRQPAGCGQEGDGASPMVSATERGAELDEVLGPVVAGAHAGGVADALHALGLAAVLLDGSGRVLHADAEAERLLAPAIKVSHGCLVGTDQASREWVESVLALVLAPRSGAARGADGLPGFGRLVVSVARIAAAGGRSSMRVSAVLLLSQAEP